MATVTVVMPTFEREELIGEAIRSALDQTYDDLVIHVGDNSDSDNTENLIKELDDPRIRYHRNRPGLGPQGNWLDLIERAETPLVATLHDDDLWAPEFLATMVPPMLDDPTLGMAFTDFWLMDEHGNRLTDYTNMESDRSRRSSIPAGRFDYDLNRGLQLVAVWNAPQPAYAAVLRRDAVVAVDFPDEFSPLYDIWLSYNMIKNQEGFYYEPQRLTSYRVHLDTFTSMGFNDAEDRIFAKILADNSNLGTVTDEIRRYWSTLRWARATRMMAAGAPKQVESRAEFAAAAGGLASPRKQLAQCASRSAIAWKLLRRCRLANRRLRPRPGDSRYGETDGVPPLRSSV